MEFRRVLFRSTPSPTPTPTPGSSGGSSGGGGYVTKPGTPRVTTKTMSGGSKVTYYIGQYTPGYGHQNLKDIKTYPTPTGGTVRTVGGQKILVASSNVKTANLSSRLNDILDDRKSTRLNSSH